VYNISVDTGGTFTDVVVTDDDSNVYLAKALTTRERAFQAISEGLTDIASTMGCDVGTLIARAGRLNYGTTRSTNTVVQGRAAKTAFLSTEGFPDILLLREGGKQGPFTPMHYRDPYIPRHLTFEIGGRILSDGAVETELDEASVRRAAEQCRERGVEAVAVCLLWSVANPDHELRVAEILAEELPDIPVTLSHRVSPTIREYRRASSTAIDASLKPSMQKFFADLDQDLKDNGFTGSLLISTSYGGGWDAARISESPVYSIGSGPSMAPVAAIRESKIDVPEKSRDVLVTDMGGTTYDISIIQDGKMQQTDETWLGGQWIGDITGTRSIDVESIGAGGGSIVWIDNGGMLRVGPQSAGSEPGPACYGGGGTEPTITDAALLLGYLDSANFLGGRLQLQRDLSEQAFAPVADRLGMSIEEAAQAAMHISVDNIVTAIRSKTVAKGIDAREMALVAGGGASGLNVGLVGQELGVTDTLIPKAAGAMSAYGAVYSDVVCEFDAVTFATTEDPDFTLVGPDLDDISTRAAEFLADNRDDDAATSVEYYAKARYLMQAWELTIPLGGIDDVRALGGREIEEIFHREHERVLGVSEPGAVIEILGVTARACVHDADTGSATSFVEDDNLSEGGASRRAYFRETGWTDMAVYSDRQVKERTSVSGPAVVLENTTTIVVYPGQTLEVRPSGNYVLSY
jgi:N-methylhydantoinase A